MMMLFLFKYAKETHQNNPDGIKMHDILSHAYLRFYEDFKVSGTKGWYPL